MSMWVCGCLGTWVLGMCVSDWVYGALLVANQRRCEIITIRFLMNVIVRIVCVHFNIHFFRITASFS